MTENGEQDDEALQRLVEQLQKEEVSAKDARLSSMESLTMWVQTHPLLQKTGIVDMLHAYGPPLLEALKRLVGA